MADDVRDWLLRCAQDYEKYPGDVYYKEIEDNVYRAAINEIESLRAEVERWAEVESYWAKVVGRMHRSARDRGLYEQTPRNLAALLDRALESATGGKASSWREKETDSTWERDEDGYNQY